MESLVASSFNLLILLGFLFVKLKRPTIDYIATRHTSIRDDIQSVQDQLRTAQEKYDESTSKLKAIDAELATLREQVKQDVVSYKQKILTEARRLSGQAVADAKSASQTLFGDLKSQLYGDLSQKVLDRAEILLKERLTVDDRARFRDEFSSQVGSIQ